MPVGWLARQEVKAFMYCFDEALPIAKPGLFAFHLVQLVDHFHKRPRKILVGRVFPSKQENTRWARNCMSGI